MRFLSLRQMGRISATILKVQKVQTNEVLQQNVSVQGMVASSLLVCGNGVLTHPDGW